MEVGGRKLVALGKWLDVLELSVRWYTVVYIPDVYIECLSRVR